MVGDGSGRNTTSAEGRAEAQYVEAKTSVWWDIENCQVPKVCDPHAIAQNISSALVMMNYCGPVSISAYGDTNRIPASVQHALSSTGIALNHVPAGVKDASDKKILVDMLFWAVDNPAPGNYLLISGDRDFSNALHQLRMRRYNILLAQPQQASAPLIAAAKSVWLWTSLLAGGNPLMSGDTLQPASFNNTFNLDSSQQPVSQPLQMSQSMTFNSESIASGNQRSSNGRAYTRKTQGQPNITRASGIPGAIEQSKNNGDSHQPQHTQAKQFKKAPHEFFGGRKAAVPTSSSALNLFPGNQVPSGNNGNNFISNPQNLYPHSMGPNNVPMRPTFAPDNSFPSNFHDHGFLSMLPRPDGPRCSSATITNHDMSMLTISEYPKYAHNPPSFHQRNGEEFKKSSIESSIPANVPKKGNIVQSGCSYHHANLVNRHRRDPDFPLPSSSQLVANNVPTNGTWGTKGFPPPSGYVQGLIGVILLALNTLKTEKLMPSEENIANCIRHGDPNHQNTDVRKALDVAIEHNRVVKQLLGTFVLYVGKNKKLWKCVNVMGGNPNQYQKATWVGIQKFLASSAGQSAIMVSHSQYEAALVLKEACLQDLALGDVLQIVNMICNSKKWIIPHHSGWQPISITLEIDPETSV